MPIHHLICNLLTRLPLGIALYTALASCAMDTTRPTSNERDHLPASPTLVSILRDTEQSFREAELAGKPLAMARAASERADWLLAGARSKAELTALDRSIAGNIETMFEAALTLAGDDEDKAESIAQIRRQSVRGGSLFGHQFGKLTGSEKLQQRRVYAARGIEFVTTVRRNTPFVHVFSSLSDVGVPIYVQPARPEQGRKYEVSLEVTSLGNDTSEIAEDRVSGSRSLICRDEQVHGRLLCFVPPTSGGFLRLVVQTQFPEVELYIFIGDRDKQVVSRENMKE